MTSYPETILSVEHLAIFGTIIQGFARAEYLMQTASLAL
jgi:hypothetical protein